MSSNEDSDGDEVLAEFNSQNTKATTLYCIDAGPNMQEINPDSKGKFDDDEQSLEMTHLFMAVDGVIHRMKTMLITNPEDNVGIMLYNTLETDIQPYCGKARSSRHCKVLMPLTQVGVQPITKVMQILENVREGSTWTEQGYAPYPKDPTIDKYIKNGWYMLKQAGKTLRNCVIITNRDDPYGPGRQMDATTNAMRTISSYSSFNIRFALYAISSKEHKFDATQFWSYIFSDSAEDEDDGTGKQSDTILNAATTFESFKTDIATKQAPKRTSFSIPMAIGENGITCDIEGYALIVPATKRKAISVWINPANPSETEKVVKLPYYQCQDTGTTLSNLEEQTEKVIEFGSTSGAKGHASLSRECHESLKVGGMTESELRILGFKDPDSLLRREHNIKHSYFLFPSTSSATNVRIFSSLYQSMAKKNRAALGVIRMRKGSSPFFCAIIPQASKNDPIIPEGLVLIPLPFADDIRPFPDPKKDSFLTLPANDDQINAMIKVAQKLTLKRDFDPHSYKNPELVYQDLVLLACAFEEEIPDPPAEDISPNYETIEERAGNLISAFNKLLFADDRSSGSARGIRAGVLKRHNDGQLERMTVVDLRDACKAFGLPVSGKKQDLIERLDGSLQ